MADLVGLESIGNRKIAGWVRKQVDLANIVQPNRYGFRAVAAHKV